MTEEIDYKNLNERAISQPLVVDQFTADPSAHVFDGRIYIYPSHDIDAGEAFDDLGSHFGMRDYHVFSMDSPSDPLAKDHGIALDIEDVPWAEGQMWAPDIARKDDKYYFYFPAKAPDGVFRIGVAIGVAPTGPFTPEPEAIQDSYSIDPAVFKDDDGAHYMYFGGLWGGQLQRWRKGSFNTDQPESPTAHLPEDHEPALLPLVAKMRDDMLEYSEEPQEVSILDENGDLLLGGDNERRYFEGPWVHKFDGKYYFSYSTGDTHYLCYAMGDSPYGPFTYKGRILEPVVGWTTHHSIVEFEGRWFLYYHDSSLSEGVTHLRCIKVTELFYNEDGTIQTIKPYRD